MTYAEALDAFRAEAGRWRDLPFFADGGAARVASAVDARAAAGAAVLPEPEDVFNAFRLTPFAAVRAVILGQDPYPTPGDAHGLAFSVRPGRRVPASLRNIFRELQDDLGLPKPRGGSLQPWAEHGVLLLNVALTVEAGKPASHRRLGWERLTDEAVAAVSAERDRVAFILWGADARRKGALVDRGRHLVLESVHPSPLAAANGFFGSKPFSKTNTWLEANGAAPIDWQLP